MSVTADLGQPIASTSTAGPAANGADERQIAIRLSTKDPKFQIPPAKFLVPASWRRFHLSELINKVLENGELLSLETSFRSRFAAAHTQTHTHAYGRVWSLWQVTIQLYDIGILRSAVFEVFSDGVELFFFTS